MNSQQDVNFVLAHMLTQGYIYRADNGAYRLTAKGEERAKQIKAGK